MVAIGVYKGRLHRVPEAPREWPMPPRTITLEQFRILTQRRARAIARLNAQNNPNPLEINKEEEEPGVKKEEEPREEEGEVKSLSVTDPQPIQVDQAPKEPEDSKMMAVDAGAAAKSTENPPVEAKAEVNNNSDALSDKENRKIELEKKLKVLNEKKHNLVQMLKQILNAEEEMKRRNAQSAALRSSVPQQAETAVDMGSATRLVPNLSVEVNFSGELGGEPDATANHSSHAQQMQNTSSAASSRPFQQNGLLPTPRPTAAASPARFASAGHHQSASLPPVSASGSHFLTSSPSPAASAFKDSRLTSSS